MHADSLICSHPRSGGRWLRFLVANYLSERYDLGGTDRPENVFAIIPDHHGSSPRGYPTFQYGNVRGFPLVSVCHQPFSWEIHRGFPTVFLARNPYDVVVSAYFHLTHEKGEYAGSLADFLPHPRFGLPAWIHYVNSWARVLLTHRDSLRIAYGDLDSDPAGVLTRVLEFLNELPDPLLVHLAVERAAALRGARKIRTGQEGNFWDHLQPEEIFEVQAIVRRDLSEFASSLLQASGVSIDPFPR